MLNWYANTFRISEKNITKAGLRRTKILTWLALLIVPIETLNLDLFENSESAVVQVIFSFFILAALIGFVGLLVSPLVHRFWARDKYLDEWEIEVKRKGMSAGYKVLFGAMVVGLAFSSFTMFESETDKLTVSYSTLDGIVFALLILAFCVQTLTHLRLIRPIDAEDIEAEVQESSPIGARIAVVVAILMLFFGPSFFQGFVEGWTEDTLEPVPEQIIQMDTIDGGTKK